jgi:4-amino-4-deoxy-L-arabinose transferase-like glycosyltransferase
MAKETNNRLILFIEQHYIFFAVLTLTFASVNLFAFLGSTPVAEWDEARYGVIMMIKNGNYVLTTYLNIPNYWTLKPPLGVWLIAAAYRIFGYSEFSLRFFSALLALLSVMLTMTLAKRHFGKSESIFSGLILATTSGFIMNHSGRTGDLDSALAFFTVLSVVFIDRSGQNIFFFYAAGWRCIALLKSFASLPIFLIILIYLWARDVFDNTASRISYLFFVSLSLTILWAVAWYFEDGFTFLQAMVSYDLLRRSMHSLKAAEAFFTI